jgi:hypothetical protein
MTSLDIRFPIGLLFCILGILLAAFGLTSDPSIYQRSLGINIDLWWGLVLTLVGAMMLFLSRRSISRRCQKRQDRDGHPKGLSSEGNSVGR